MDCELEEFYGQPIWREGGRSYFNHSFFAALLLKESRFKFVGRSWYMYDGKCWREGAHIEVSKRATEILREFVKNINRPGLLPLINGRLSSGIVAMVQEMAHESVFPPMDQWLIPCQNTVLRWNKERQEFVPEGFSSEQNIRSLLTVDYDPEASYDKFERIVLDEVMTREDASIVQDYLGIALMPINLTENFLLLKGVAGSSKSILVRLLMEILGEKRFFDLNIKDLGQTFELSGLDEQTLLVASDAAGDVLCSSGASFIKKMSGGDRFQGRRKYANKKTQLCGNYSIIIVSNEQMAFHYEGDGKEWGRRLLPIFFEKPHEEVIKGLVHKLLREHGSGILNWLLEGATRVLRNGWNIDLTPEQAARRDCLIACSEPVKAWIVHCIVRSAGDDFTSEEAYCRYCEFTQKSGLPTITRETFCKKLSIQLAEIFPGAVNSNNIRRNEAGRDSRTCRGYRGYKLIN